MQLRVARLCLDCEELHSENCCPRCASQSYAFLVNWLPVEERRRWRRPAPIAGQESVWSDGPAGLVRAFGRWLSGEATPITTMGPATRAADRAAMLNFDGPNETPSSSQELDLRVTKPGTPKA